VDMELIFNLQIDKVEFPSWQTQISGYKKWTLRTPAECFFKCKRMFEVFMEPGSTSECLLSTLFTFNLYCYSLLLSVSSKYTDTLLYR